MVKVTFRYDEPEDADRQLCLRITLGAKHLDGPATNVVSLIADYYNKKFPDAPIDASVHCLKVLAGAEVSDNANIRTTLKDGDEVFLLPRDVNKRRKYVAPAPPAAAVAPAVVVPKEKDTRLRCKRFGCNLYYVEGSQEICKHHEKAPIFHETAKYWSCCSNKKAYDWEEFERIPGCQETVGHTQEVAKKQVLGGCDLRAECAPQRIDGGLPTDPRKHLEMLREAMLAMGTEKEFFDKVWGRLAAKYGDLKQVTKEVRQEIEIALERVSSPDMNMLG